MENSTIKEVTLDPKERILDLNTVVITAEDLNSQQFSGSVGLSKDDLSAMAKKLGTSVSKFALGNIDFTTADVIADALPKLNSKEVLYFALQGIAQSTNQVLEKGRDLIAFSKELKELTRKL